MATFHPNPNYANEPWFEKPIIEGAIFRVWHVIFFCFAAFVSIVILTCCCVKIRIPRTKQEIEADYQRKKLAAKFKERLRLIENQEMDDIDLQRALEIIQEDYKSENKNINDQLSAQLYPDFNTSETKNLVAEPQHPSKGFGKIMTLMRMKKLSENS